MARLADPATLLRAWDHGAAVPEVARPAVALAYDLARSVDDILDLGLGESAALAISALAELSGDILAVSCDCAHCGEINEVAVDLRQLPNDPRGDSPIQLGADVRVRALTGRDLMAVAVQRDPAAALRRLAVSGRSETVTEDELEAMRGAIDAAVETLAGAAALTLRMCCPGCGTEFTGYFDAAALLWEHVDAVAPTLIAHVATLAAAYGWTESEVLGMSEHRRRAYLELAAATHE